MTREAKRELEAAYKSRGVGVLHGPIVWARIIALLLARNNIRNSDIILDVEYPGHEAVIRQIPISMPRGIFTVSGILEKNPAHEAAYLANKKDRSPGVTPGSQGLGTPRSGLRGFASHPSFVYNIPAGFGFVKSRVGQS